jgi:hypothetical protein
MRTTSRRQSSLGQIFHGAVPAAHISLSSVDSLDPECRHPIEPGLVRGLVLKARLDHPSQRPARHRELAGRTVRMSSGAQAVQIVYSRRRGARQIEHIGSAHDEVELEVLRAVARQRLAAGQDELELGLEGATSGTPGAPLPITSSRMAHLWDALCQVYDWLGFDVAAGGDAVFRDLSLVRLIEPTSKLDSLRVLSEVGAASVSNATVNRPVSWLSAWSHRVARTAGWCPGRSHPGLR